MDYFIVWGGGGSYGYKGWTILYSRRGGGYHIDIKGGTFNILGGGGGGLSYGYMISLGGVGVSFLDLVTKKCFFPL